MTEKKQTRDMGIGPSTKKLKSMLKILSEHGVVRYKDNEFEIELVAGFQPGVEEAKSETFNFSNYDTQALSEDKTEQEARDDLGFTSDDYLWRSAET